MKYLLLLLLICGCVQKARLADTEKTCPETRIVNKTDEWNKTDQDTLDRAKNRCAQLYDESPCLTYFEKYEFNSYRALCGAKR